EGWTDAEAGDRMALIIDTIRALRSIRAEFRLGEHAKIDAVVMATSDRALEILNEGRAFIENLGRTAKLTLQPVAEEKPRNAATAVVAGAEIYVPLGGLIDLPKEIERITKELKATGDELARLEKKLGNEGFLTKAKPEIVEK